MQDQNTIKLVDALDEAEKRLSARGLFTPSDLAHSTIEALARDFPGEWAAIRDDLALASIITTAQRRMLARALQSGDPRQEWLGLPGFDRVPRLIEIDAGFLDMHEATLEQYRESAAELSSRIRSYNYPRRSEEKLRRDKETLAQMRKLGKKVAPLMAGDPEMKMRDGLEAFERLGGHKSASRMFRASKGGQAKSRAMKNQ